MKFQEIYNTINESKGRVLPTLIGISFTAEEYADLLDICLYWIGDWNEKSLGNDISIKLYRWIMSELRTRKLKNKFTSMELNSELDRVNIEALILRQSIRLNNNWKPLAKEIKHELSRSIEKHPNYPRNRFEQVCIIQKELGEVTKAVLQLEQESKGSIQEIKSELIQTAAMCIKMLINM